MTNQAILNIPFYSDDLNDTVTIKEYLKELLVTLWKEGEGFSGKRPFGNSGWESDLYLPLVEHNVLHGKIDNEFGDLLEVDKKQGHKLILDLINEVFQ